VEELMPYQNVEVMLASYGSFRKYGRCPSEPFLAFPSPTRSRESSFEKYGIL
jgi:hypothetical protein